MALKSQESLLNQFNGTIAGDVERARFKDVKGRGRKKYAWVAAMYPCLISEFERLKTVGVKLSCGVLYTLVKALIMEQEAGSPFGSAVYINGI